jgi:hypothetical protein
MVTTSLEPITLFPIFILPLLVVRWAQLRSGQYLSVYMIVPIIQMLLLFLAGYSLLTIVLIGLFSCWRMYTHLKEPYLDNQGIWLGLVLTATFAILLLKKEQLLEYVSWFIVLILLFLAIRIMLHLKGNTWSFMKKGYQVLILYLGAALLVLLVVYQGSLFLLKTILPYIGQGVAYVFSYPLAWLIKEWKPNDPDYEGVIGNLEKMQEEPFKNMNQSYVSSNDQLILYLILFAVIIAICFILYFTRKNLLNREGEATNGILVEDGLDSGFTFFNPLKRLNPFYSNTGKNEARIQFQKLQVYLEKRGYGRQGSETAEEWFTRLGLMDSYGSTVLELYSRSRYSPASFTDRELDSFYKEIKEIKPKFPKKKVGGI